MQHRRKRALVALGGVVAAIAVVAACGSGGDSGTASSAPGLPAVAPAPARAQNGADAAGSAGSATASSPTSESGTADTEAEQIGLSTGATRVVKTGSLDLQVPRGQVETTIANLVKETTGLGGYVSSSRTENLGGQPTGQLTLRIPAADFDTAVAAAAKLGHETSLTTSAKDVTGKYVDLQARAKALRQTRQTYLTILAGAKTVGATLSVQQRVEDTQQQIEELQGEIKLLGNQSADGTLAVDVTQVGAVTVVHHKHHSGLGSAWHTSIHRFTRGFDAIVSALGAILLALLIVVALAVLGGLTYLGVRRMTRRPGVVDPTA